MTTPTLWIAAGWTMCHFVWIGTAIVVIAAWRGGHWLLAPEARYPVALVPRFPMTVAPIATFFGEVVPSNVIEPPLLAALAGMNNGVRPAKTCRASQLVPRAAPIQFELRPRLGRSCFTR